MNGTKSQAELEAERAAVEAMRPYLLKEREALLLQIRAIEDLLGLPRTMTAREVKAFILGNTNVVE